MAITQYVSIATIPLLIILSAFIAVWIKSRRNRRPPQIPINVRVDDQTTTKEGEPSLKPISVNYHLTRQCNYKCGFCFHTAKTSFVLPIEEARKGLTLLKNDGMEKVNFAGGEPFIVKRGAYLGELVRFCKEDLQLPSVTVVSNGSLITEKWFEKYGKYLDILAVSCDSFDPETNRLIGRCQNSTKKDHLESLYRVRDWCLKYEVAFKINTVVNVHNKNEDMNAYISELGPCRWKVFQCLLIGGENAGKDAIRNAEGMVVTSQEFKDFCERHKNITSLVPESNEQMRFLDCTRGSKDPSRSLLDVGVKNALKFSGFDEKMFLKRGGKYTWSKADMKLDW